MVGQKGGMEHCVYSSKQDERGGAAFRHLIAELVQELLFKAPMLLTPLTLHLGKGGGIEACWAGQWTGRSRTSGHRRGSTRMKMGSHGTSW